MRLFLLLFCLTLAVAEAKPLTPYNQGYDQGRQAGRREGRERGGIDGRCDGEADGYQQGLIQGQQQLQNEAWAQGQTRGQQEGQSAGAARGEEAGLKLGEEEGTLEGQRRARLAADQAALEAVKLRALTDGRDRAASVDPVAEGRQKGRAAGQERARQQAAETDFQRGREEYRQERFQSPVAQEQKVRQAQLSSALPLWYRAGEQPLGRRARPPCQYRFCHYPSDNEEFQRAYRKGYYAGYCSAYDSQYDWEYRSAFNLNLRWGANQARGGDLSQHTEQAYREAYESSFQQSFQEAQESARKEAFTVAFEISFQQEYAKLYPGLEKEHYARLEEEAFQAEYGPQYQPVFDKVEAETFAKSYPEEAIKAYAEGRKAEKREFESRPVRLLGAWLTPTDVEGLQLLSLKVRNFSAQTVAGHRVKVNLGEKNSRLYHALPANSVVTITGLFRIHQGESVPEQLSAALTTEAGLIPLGQLGVGNTEGVSP